MTAHLITVYTPDGDSETHTRLNAVDLVRHSGYTYKPGKVYTPIDTAPYAVHGTPSTPEPAHAVLASVGSGSAIGMDINAPAPTYTTAPEPVVVFDAGKVEEASIVSTESKPTAVRRGRPSKAQLDAEAAEAAAAAATGDDD